MCCSPIAITNICWAVVMPGRCSLMLCAFGGFADSGVGVKVISMPSSSRCCSRLSAQQFGVSSIGEVKGSPLNLLQLFVCDFVISLAFLPLYSLHLSTEVGLCGRSPVLILL